MKGVRALSSLSIPDALSALTVDPELGLASDEVSRRRKIYGFNEIAERKGHPVLQFLKHFWGVSAWMLELIMVLSIALRHLPDLLLKRVATTVSYGSHHD